MEENEKTLRDYLLIIRRRKAMLIWPAVVLMLLTMIVAAVLPAIYQSSATILIEQQDIPQDLVQSTITTYADQRLQVISQRVMTTANLSNVVKKYNLYADMLERNTITSVLGKMRDDISMEMVSADVVDPRSGRPTQATIAFTLSYDNESPELAQKVTNELVSLYLSENIKTRTEKTEDTSEFLTQEAEKLKAEIQQIEKKLADFKEQNSGSLPELMQLNIQLMERSERELNEIDSRIRSLIERKAYLEAELSQIHPDVAMFSKSGVRILSTEDRLKALKAQYAQMVATYSPQHPDVKRTRQEIQSLENELGGSTSTRELHEQLTQQQSELATLREKYSAEHPSVKKLKKSIASLQASIKKASAKKSARPVVTAKPDNPAYIQLLAQLNAANSEIDSYTTQKIKIKQKMNELENRLLESPQVEREYRDLTRDYENANLRYQEIKAKQNSAQLGEQLEKGQQGERLSLIEPPLLPEKPIKPNRMAILFLGFVFSISAGVGTVAIAESMNRTIRGPSGVMKILSAPPIGIIPLMQVQPTTSNRKKIWALILALILLVIVIASVAIHLLVMPLDVLWYVLLRKAGI